MASHGSDLIEARPGRHRPGRTRLAAATEDPRILGVAASVLLFAFIFSLLIPANLQIGGLRLTPYRLFLMVVFVPLLLRLIEDRERPFNGVDAAVLAYIGWQGVALVYHYGLGRVPFFGSMVLDQFGGYMIGRVLIRNVADYRLFFKYFTWGLVFLLVPALIELLTRRNILFELVSYVAEPGSKAGNPPRLGLHRVQTAFDHPILFGVFCMIGVANVFYLHPGRFLQRWVKTGFVAFMTLVSLSSAPIMGMILQFGLMAWRKATVFLPGRWVVLVSVGGGILVFAWLATGGELLNWLIANATFEPNTGFGRVEIFVYGSAEALRNPLFGIGFGEWERPFWRGASVDNFWLANALTYGMPAVLFFLLALLLHFFRAALARGLDPEEDLARTGHLIGWAAVFFTLATVQIYTALAPFFMAYLGAGSWLYTGRSSPVPRARPLPAERRSIPERIERSRREGNGNRRSERPERTRRGG